MSFAEEFGHDIPPDDWDGGGYSRRKKSTYVRYDNPLFKHHAMHVKKVVIETEKAFLLEFLQGKAWVPKSKVRFFLKDMVLYLPLWLKQNLEFKP